MIVACGDQVVVKPLYEKQSRGGIIIPDYVQKNNSAAFGKIISVGPDVSFRDEIKKGDVIFFTKNEGTLLETSQGEFLALSEKWVLALKEED